jgi:hypothetical protein
MLKRQIMVLDKCSILDVWSMAVACCKTKKKQKYHGILASGGVNLHGISMETWKSV